MTPEAFIEKWTKSGGSERANFQPFLTDLCDLLGVPKPEPSKSDDRCNFYVFERAVQIRQEGGKVATMSVDLYKHRHFIMEAKQGSNDIGDAPALQAQALRKLGIGKRERPGWQLEMERARGQAVGYARSVDPAPPFILLCDVGFCFDLFAKFNDSGEYTPFPSTIEKRIYVRDLGDPDIRARLKAIFEAPESLDPRTHSVKVTRIVAAHLAKLAKELETAGHAPEAVARFLMRCLFTMFAEDVDLLPRRLFTDLIKDDWIPNPSRFATEIETLWAAMNDGRNLFKVGKLLRFNGGLFVDPAALPLNEKQLRLLLDAAECDWSSVEPAIFGTLLERALNAEERHKLGAHFTPRSYVERLVRPTVEEPLREDWARVKAEALGILQRIEARSPPGLGMTLPEYEKLTPTKRRELDEETGKYGKAVARAREAARVCARRFRKQLTETVVLDPACGSGNFLYVTLDAFKRLESDVTDFLVGLGEKRGELLATDAVTPAQFLGIEKNPRAKEIADLVLWIGYLQWHYRTHQRTQPPPEPVLQDYRNIECRDALIVWDRIEAVVDSKTGEPETRWDEVSMKRSPVTGELVPNEDARVPVEQYVRPRKATWPPATFIVGNPPFIGNRQMRNVLGWGYIDAIREAHDGVPETSDFVMYWWDQAARLLAEGKIRRFGLVTTNSITQPFNRKVVRSHLASGISFVFAVPDHPWVDTADGAAVRIAMTVAEMGTSDGMLQEVAREIPLADGEYQVLCTAQTGRIHEDLTLGANVASAVRLRANMGICGQGMKLVGDFDAPPNDWPSVTSPTTEASIVRRFINPQDVLKGTPGKLVIDFFGLDEDTARALHPAAYQRLLDHVKPFRDHNKRKPIREIWWRFAWERPVVRKALRGLSRYFVTLETAKHRFFVALDRDVLWDGSLFAIATDDDFVLGVLSSRVHVAWALAAGGTLEDRPRWNNSVCFDPFPFPVPSADQRARVAKLADGLDAHRKKQQAAHPGLKLTDVYNVLAKLRAKEELTAKERVTHERGLVALLRQLHADLDGAVLDAYGWPRDLNDEQIVEKLVVLNAARAEEERNGFVRWLRPEFQNPTGQPTQVELAGVDEDDDDDGAADVANVPAFAARAWPKKMHEQIAAVRDLLAARVGSLTSDDIAAKFKGAVTDDVEPVLESLAALGLIVRLQAQGGARWQPPAESLA